MALWGNTDNTAGKPKFLNAADAAKAFFVSKEEALLDENKSRGINGAGWWIYETYQDSNGNTRHKANCLVAMTTLNAVSGDAADDATVADVASAITITAQPTDQTESAGAATFSVTASADVGSVTYQWQSKTVGGRWSNVSGATSASLALTGLVAGDDQTQYRVKLNSDAGAEEVVSDAATLTVSA